MITALLAVTTMAAATAKTKNNADAWDVACRLLQAEKQMQQGGKEAPNLCVSPLSLELALAMVAEGASGETATELSSLLPANVTNLSKELTSDGQTLTAANSIWVNQDIATNVKKKFIKNNVKKYDAEVTRLAFNPAAVARINLWCKDKTRGLIPSIISQLNADDKMVLVNALYFKAEWKNEFKKNQTHDRPFHLSDGSDIEVPMMLQTSHLSYAEDDYCQAVGLPYKQKADEQSGEPIEKTQYAMYVLLPKEGIRITDFVNRQLSASYWKQLKFGAEEQVRLQLPKWENNYSTSLVRPLQQMGIQRIFSPKAQFGGISKTPLTVGDILQKTYIKVDEKGTEAAAATAVIMRLTSAAPAKKRPIEMTVDRPFVYFLVETTTNTPVFAGIVMNPKTK